MKQKMITVGMLLAMAVTAMGDYVFPSAMPPGNQNLDTVKQIVTFIWDDNAYSGLEMTNYETEPGQAFADQHWVGGKKPWGATAQNVLGLESGDFGVSWAITKLVGGPTQLPPPPYDPSNANVQAPQQYTYNDTVWEATGWMGANSFPSLDPNYPTNNGDTWEHLWKFVSTVDDLLANVEKTNPDGEPLTMTFNMISGLFVPIYDNPAGGTGDGYRVSKYGYWQPNAQDLIEFPHLVAYNSPQQTLPVAWGREMPVKKTADSEGNVNGEAYGRINDAVKMAMQFGHEIGNHTLDHMESNSMLPKSYFDSWGGYGFAADHITEVSYGDTSYIADETEEFGRTLGISWHTAGWELYVGKMLPQQAWAGLIELGEVDLEIELGLTPRRSGGSISAFRAPRLEVSSGLYYALKDLGYLYDCGLEEGYDYYVDGTNFLWPYTLDNGSPNLTWQRTVGAHMSIDSTAPGLWQIPVNTMIVPEAIRSEVFDNYSVMRAADGETLSQEDKDYWVNQSGKVTGFDFNMFILWGMTKDQALQTLKHNLDLRLAGNKAPMQFGAHTDYYSPMYDNATLAADSVYKHALTFNSWLDRIWVLEQFVDYGMSKGVYFWSGEKVVDYVRTMSEQTYEIGAVEKSPTTWSFFKNDALNASSFTGDISGADISNVQVTVGVEDSALGEYPDAGFKWSFTAGELAGLSHISLDYKTDFPLVVRLVKSTGDFLEAPLGSLKNNVSSGMIPVSAFHENQYKDAFTASADGVSAYPGIDASQIVAIEIQALTSGKKEVTGTISIANLKAYTGATTPVSAQAKQAAAKVGVKRMTSSALSLDVPSSGVYSVNIVSANGRVLKSFTNTDMKQGVNTLQLGNLSRGIYMINIVGHQNNLQKTIKSVVR